jgi:DNA-binding transcriptional LysR family regulator
MKSKRGEINSIYMKRTAELRTLRSFITVAREGNISRAAESLNLTQPAVSLQLKRLAEDTGLTLFRRTSKGMELTPNGAALLVKAERVFAALSDFGQTARRVSGHVRGQLRIGTIVDPDFIRLGQFLAGLVESFPELQAELIHGMSGEIIPRLLSDRIDVGYFLDDLDGFSFPSEAGQPDKDAQIHLKKLTTFTYKVIAPSGWEPLVMGKDWAALAELPWIGTPPASVHSRLLSRIFARHGCVQNRVALVDQEPSMLAMVQSGVGLSLSRESIALEQKQSRGIVIADKVQIDTSLSFVTLRARLNDPNVAAAIEILDDVWSM